MLTAPNPNTCRLVAVTAHRLPCSGEAHIAQRRMSPMHARTLDWNDLRLCLALARRGTLTGAAHELGVTQPTVGRRLETIEHGLGTVLFVRSTTGFIPSEAGQAVAAEAEVMERAALAATRAAIGRDAGMAGSVSVTASEWLIERVLAPRTIRFLDEHPEIRIELVAGGGRLSLVRREVDVAIRPAPFEHRRIVQRRAATVPFALYASDGYLERRGIPDFATGAIGHRLVTMSEREVPIADVAWLVQLAPHAKIAACANGRLAMLAMAAAGVGIACLPRLVADPEPSLRRLEAPLPPPVHHLRLGLHPDTRDIPRVRRFVDFLAAELAALDPAT